jgi:hypothetical protein
MRWPELRWPLHVRGEPEPQIDMGNGRLVSAADVLEGHYRRLATRTVTVQVQPDLQSAITVVAPELAPLTAVAADVAQAMPSIQPTMQFRQELHRALELSHRQQQAQRILGTYPAAAENNLPWGLLIGVAVLVTVLVGWLLVRRRHEQAAAS